MSGAEEHRAGERGHRSLLDELPGHADETGTVDLRPHLAAAVPLRVICELVGVPEGWQASLRHVVEILFRTDTTSEQFARNDARRRALLADLIDLRRREPGEDLTSALIDLNDREDAQLSDSELVDTLWLLVTAGHETTLSLINNAVHALLHHPDQRAIRQRDLDARSQHCTRPLLPWQPTRAVVG